jgi:hypothetical protein
MMVYGRTSGRRSTVIAAPGLQKRPDKPDRCKPDIDPINPDKTA